MSRRILLGGVAIASGWVIVAGGYILTVMVFSLFNQEGFTPGAPLRTGWLLFTLAASAIWSIAAGFVTGVIARRREVEHAIGLTLFTLAVSMYFVSRNRNLGQVPTWYMIAGEAVTALAILMGGWLRRGQRILLGEMPEGVTGTVDNARLSIAMTVDRWRFLMSAVVAFITFLACFWALVLGAGEGVFW